MLYPQNGSMANGSNRRLPTAPAWAAVVSLATVDPMNTPWFHENDSLTSGTVEARRPPNKMAEIGHTGASQLATYWVGQGVGLMDQAMSCAQVVQQFREDFLEARERLITLLEE